MAKQKKGFFSKLATFFIVLLVLVFLVFVSGGIFHLVTKEKAERYIPDDFIGYAEIDSISELFDSFMNLQAAKYLLANQSLNSFYNLYNTLKSNQLLNSFAGRWLLDVDASLVLNKNNNVAIIVDMGIRSFATRLINIVDRLGAVKGLSVIVETEDYVIYQFIHEDNAPLYLSIKNNLVLVSSKSSALLDLYRKEIVDESILNLPELNILRSQAGKGRMINFYIRTKKVLETVLNQNKVLSNFLSNADLGDFSFVSLDLKDSEIQLDFVSQFEVGEETKKINESAQILDRIISYDVKPSGVLRLLPQNANIVTSLRFEDFKDFYKLFFFLNDMDYVNLSRKIDSMLGLALGQRINSDELFFDWIGNEGGLFFLKGSIDPVLFLHMKDPDLQQEIFDKLDKSVFLTSERATVIDGVLLGKIGFPDTLMPLLNLIKRGIDAPYYVAKDDYLFLSMNGEELAQVIKSNRLGEKLVRDSFFRDASISKFSDSHFFGYYDLNRGMPEILKRESLVWNLFSLYARGTSSVCFEDDFLHVSAIAKGRRKSNSILYPGYPRNISGGAISSIYAANLIGNRADEFIYLDKANNLVILDASLNRVRVPVQKNSDIILQENKRESRLFVSSKEGTLYSIDGAGNFIPPFPIETGFLNSFSPVIYGKGFLYFSKLDKKLFKVDFEGKESALPYQFDGDILFSPVVKDNLIAFYPRKFTGEVHCIALDGVGQAGWPVLGGGISASGPIFADYKDKDYILFLTQSGILNCWDLLGQSLPGFPLKLEGVFYAPPVLLNSSNNEKSLALLDESGVLFIVSFDGQILRKKNIFSVAGTNSKVLAYDADKDGQDEIYIYGDFNYILGMTNELIKLKGFPVKGKGKPAFSDLDFNGKDELICKLYDKDGKDKLYAWYIVK